jgi:predicted nucleic acid-binding Zn ribbon protein
VEKAGSALREALVEAAESRGAEGNVPQEQSAEKGGAKPYNRYPARRRRPGLQTDLTKVKSILSRVLAYRGLDKKVDRYAFILRWHEIVGERLAEVSKPEYIRNKALIVNVLHPAWAQELTMIKPVLLESLAKYLQPGDVVRDMVFRVDSVG